MKRPIVLSLTVMLAGCGPTFPTVDAAALREAVAQVQGYTVEICQYLPTNATVVDILTTSDVLETAYKIASQICSAVTEVVPPLSPAQMQQPRLGDAEQCPMVRGICIEGRFLNPQAGGQQQ
jgi:hypothetical protein